MKSFTLDLAEHRDFYSDNGWDAPVALSRSDLALLEAVDGRRPAAEVLSAASNGDGGEALRRQARCGVLDLL
jgi:hypothetical protein